MIEINGPALNQWDTGRSVKITEIEVEHAHFANKGDSKAVIVGVVDSDAKIPDFLLQTGKQLCVYAVKDGITLESRIFSVKDRARPENYVYEEDQRNYIYELITNAETAIEDAQMSAEGANKAAEEALTAAEGANKAAEEAQKASDNANEAASKWGPRFAECVTHTEQSLTKEQKAQARFNIGAVGQFENTAEGKNFVLKDSANSPVLGLQLYASALQDGTGTASPTNIRPITGMDTITVTTSNADETISGTHTATFPQTCYGGYIDWTRNKFMQEWEKVDWESIGMSKMTANCNAESNVFYISVPRKLRGTRYCLSSHLRNDVNVAASNDTNNGVYCHAGDDTWGGIVYLRIRLDATETPITTSAEFKQWLIDNDVTVIYRYAKPIEHDLAEVLPELYSFYPETKVSTDGEKAVITYVADAKNYIDKKFNELATAMIANG